jgi:hypothetical protein
MRGQNIQISSVLTLTGYIACVRNLFAQAPLPKQPGFWSRCGHTENILSVQLNLNGFPELSLSTPDRGFADESTSVLDCQIIHRSDAVTRSEFLTE